MSNIVLIGQSPAIPAAIAALREDGQERRIVFISTDGCLPYDRELLPRLMNRKSSEKQLFCVPETFYKDNGVEVVLDKELSRVNVNRRKVFLSDKVQFDFDALLVADVAELRFPDIKGLRKQGVFNGIRLDAVRRMIKYLPQTETVAVVPASLRGIEWALAFKKLGKEVLLTFSGEKLPGVTAESAEDLALLAEKSGLRVLLSHGIEDILGDSDVKAIRLKGGKVMACEMVFFEEALPDMRLLSESGLLVQERCCVHTNMRTNVPTVYAADVLMEMMSPRMVGGYGTSRMSAEEQGRCAAHNMMGRDHVYEPQVQEENSSFQDLFPINVQTEKELS